MIRNNTWRFHLPITLFTPMVTSYKTIAQYHNQDIDTGTVKVHNSSSITRISQMATPISVPCHPSWFLATTNLFSISMIFVKKVT